MQILGRVQDGHKCSREEVDGTCPYFLYHVGTGSGGPGVAMGTWFNRPPNQLRIAGTNGGVTNNAVAYAAAAYAAYAARQPAQQQQQQQQQDPWAAHHRQAGGGGPH